MECKKRVLLIGLGVIATKYIAGLKDSPYLELVYTCDINPQAPARALLNDIPFGIDYKEIISSNKIDIAIIATPPSSHFEIINECHKAGLKTIVEKPLCASEENCIKLIERENPNLDVIFHWIEGCEVKWFIENIKLNQIESININISDPYADENGVIKEEYYNKCGCWMDSGVNALSLLSQIIDLESLKINSFNSKIDTKSGFPYETLCQISSDTTHISINITWSKMVDRKESLIIADGHIYRLDHSNQSVSIDGKEVFRDESMPRLAHHYYNYFTNYPHCMSSFETIKIIHNFLFKANSYEKITA